MRTIILPGLAIMKGLPVFFNILGRFHPEQLIEIMSEKFYVGEAHYSSGLIDIMS